MNAYELADELEAASSEMEYNHIVSDWKLLFESAIVLRKLQAENEALKNRVEEVKETNGRFVDLVQLQREEIEKMRQEILMWENAEVPTEVMADLVEELERRGFITK